MTHLLRTSIAIVLALSLMACQRSGFCPTEEPETDARALTLGERPSGSFVPLMEGGDASLVLGPQGGWMVVLEAELEDPIPEGECYLLEVYPWLDGDLLSPIVVRDPAVAPDQDRVSAQVLLGFDRELLEGHTLSLLADLRTRTWSAEGEVNDLRLVAME